MMDREAIPTRSPWKGESGLEIGPDDLHALSTFSPHSLGLDRVEKQDLERRIVHDSISRACSPLL